MTLEEVAKRARVSTSTVSRVLNETGPVRAATRARVLKAIKDLKYQPNLNARTLAGGRSQTLGLIVSNLENPFFLDIFRALDAKAQEQGYEVLVSSTDYTPRRLISSVHLMLQRRVAGLVLIICEVDEQLFRDLYEGEVPVVFYDVGSPAPHVTNIRVDYQRGVRRIVEYLRVLGHRRFGFVGHHTALSPLLGRKQAFLEIMKTYGTDVQYSMVDEADSTEGGRRAAHRLMESGVPPTAILCINDFMAMGVIRALKDRGLDVPGDVSVTGFDNISLAQFSIPTLTTASVPRDEVGCMAFEALTRSWSPNEVPRTEMLIDPELVIRDSTGPVKRNRVVKEPAALIAMSHPGGMPED